MPLKSCGEKMVTVWVPMQGVMFYWFTPFNWRLPYCFCLFVLGFLSCSRNFTPLLEKSCKVWPLLWTHGHSGFFSVPHLLWQWSAVYIIVIFGDLLHSHLLPSVGQWICHYFCLRRRSVALGIQTPNVQHAMRAL